MDKKNTILGIICIVAGIGYMYKQADDALAYQNQQQLEEASLLEQAAADGIVESTSSGPTSAEADDSILELLTREV